MIAGTPQYMSPEQAPASRRRPRSDLFSLGSVMYAMCTGHAPFRAESVFAVLQRIVHDEPRPIRDANPTVPAWLEAFIERLMAKDRDERFQSAAEVAELLSRELAHLQDPRRHPAARALGCRRRTPGIGSPPRVIKLWRRRRPPWLPSRRPQQRGNSKIAPQRPAAAQRQACQRPLRAVSR